MIVFGAVDHSLAYNEHSINILFLPSKFLYIKISNKHVILSWYRWG